MSPGAHLDGDGEQLSLLVQVEEAQRSRQVRLLPVDHVGRDAVQNLVVQKVHGSPLSNQRASSGAAEINNKSLPAAGGQVTTHSPVAPARGRSLQAGRGGACQR